MGDDEDLSLTQQFLYASGSILILSLVGLLGILLVPIVNRVLYNHLLQFLVAMAAGALAGDALLHLLPEALGLHRHAHHHESNETSHEHGHNETHHEEHSDDHMALWKCCVCFLGIYAFFLVERLMGIFREFTRRKKAVAEIPSKKELPMHQHDHCHTHVVGFKLSGTSANQCVIPCDAAAEKNEPNGNVDQVAMQSLLCGKEEPSSDVIVKRSDSAEDANHHGGHSHSHGHSHAGSVVPSNIASVAWMVILGDGIHNLIDGLTVGVAFRTRTGGLSTSLAVLLHEIPHELGDFAVLLRAGMSVKLAVFYNMVSSVISFIGMVAGVFLAKQDDTRMFVHALAAGGFLYIALVDLLPELRPVEARRDESPLWHLLLQNLGLLFGAGIMLLIAFYEHEIQKIF